MGQEEESGAGLGGEGLGASAPLENRALSPRHPRVCWGTDGTGARWEGSRMEAAGLSSGWPRKHMCDFLQRPRQPQTAGSWKQSPLETVHVHPKRGLGAQRNEAFGCLMRGWDAGGILAGM